MHNKGHFGGVVSALKRMLSLGLGLAQAEISERIRGAFGFVLAIRTRELPDAFGELSVALAQMMGAFIHRFLVVAIWGVIRN